ncbi:mediator of RNA polymerase II transcription subunit 13 [Iris pallida]|uniref:Mediator of RNA polymerase II transcription subunit 13 n=1 Tax=Iris pallida TaxID=29817 RepID=A0AAX6GHX4_IRIPA|nr:mediator of RNA polymerase II transcription subunit 13 [Iris pallida]
MLSGFSIPKLVLQIVTVECLLRVNKPLNELAVLKDIAFTVYNKARRIPRAISSNDIFQPSSMPVRSHSSLMHLSSPIGLWKDCLAPRMSGPALSRDGEIDSALRSGTWDNSWPPSRAVGVNCEPNRSSDLICQDDTRYMFEPLFILAEPGSVEHGTSPNVFGSAVLESANLKSVTDDSSGMYTQSSASGGSVDVGTGSQLDGLDRDQRPTSLHCCYGWTEDWRWLVCIWTDSRGELLDCNIFPFGGISSRQDTKVLQSLFVQVLNQGCQILSSSLSDSVSVRARDVIITRIGCFFELECQEWQNAIYSVGGSDVKKWTRQLRRSIPDSLSSNTNGSGIQQQEMGLIQERNLPSSPSSSLYSPRAKSSFVKGVLGQTNTKNKLLAGQTGPDNSRGLLQFVQSISLVGVSIDHSMHLILPADSSAGGGAQNSNSSSAGFSAYIEGFTPVKSLGSMPASYVLIPSPNMRTLSPAPMQLPTCLTSESPPLAHLLHSKGSAIPLSTGYVVSKAVPPMRKDPADPAKEDWPSVLAVTLIDHYGGGCSSSSSGIQEKMARGGSKEGRRMGAEANNIGKDHELETHTILESVAAELHSLSWMTVSPVYLERRTALPFHCDLLLRLRRLLHYADKELSRLPERTETTT